jgi:hypothetical protein
MKAMYKVLGLDLGMQVQNTGEWYEVKGNGSGWRELAED